MTDLFAIDPGVKTCATALARSSQLVCIASMPSFMAPLIGRHCAVIWERPQADGRGAPVDDLIALTHAGADLARAVAGRDMGIRAVTPRQWKGSVPKPVHHGRLLDVLLGAELDLLGGHTVIRAAVEAAARRGAADGWRKPGATYYRARELPTVDGVKITHDLLDAVALLMFGLGRLAGP